MQIYRTRLDYTLLFVIAILLTLSVTFIYTASSTKALENFGDGTFFLKRQILRILIGVLIMYLAMRIDYREFLRFSPVFYWGALTLLLVLIFAPDEWTVRSTRRWLYIFGFRFQPSELAKFAIILMFARILAMKEVDNKSFLDGVISQLILLGLVCGAIMLEPDTGTALMVFVVGIYMLFVAGARVWHLLAVIAGGLTAAFMFLMSIPYQRERLFGFIDGFKDETQLGWQVKQSLISLGNGGVFGLGLGHSRQKMHWLPDPFTDFIYSIIGEELGMIGTLLVVLLFLVIFYRGYRIALAAPDREGQLLALGITFAIVLYGFMNIAVVTNLMPTTGIPMPFVSYGGSSLIMNLFVIGILLNICQQSGFRALKPVQLKYGKKSTTGRKIKINR